MSNRDVSDSMGRVQVPESVYYGAQTRRAMDNFPVSSLRFPKILIDSIALIKKCAAQVNQSLGLIEAETANAVIQAAQEVRAGEFDADFDIDVFQTGSGTSTNMNVNEVIATRANEILTGKKETLSPVHPNDHVNRCQSSNDVIPSAIHISAMRGITEHLKPALAALESRLKNKADEFRDIEKIGRTHLQDAVVMTLGDEFSGYARQAALSIHRLDSIREPLCRLALGGTAVGTGLNAHPDFAREVIARIAEATNMPFIESPNHFEAQGTADGMVQASGIMKTIAVSLSKMANDIRFLASGPRCGLGEINLPALQPGSSIMPGKVNPVICESVIQVGAQVIGNDAAITIGGLGSYFELNLMLPLIGFNLLQSVELLANAADLLAEKCVAGITANQEKCKANVRQSLAVVTNLVPLIGYDRAAKIAKEAYRSGRTIEAAAGDQNILPEDELKKVLYGQTVLNMKRGDIND